jgi:hypothetical protein
MEAIAFTGGFSRALRLNRNEGTLQSIKAKLDDEYRDFSVNIFSPLLFLGSDV